jgi:hypothetical protein
MADLRIDGQDFRVGRWHFPVFSLRGGECVTLCFPKEAYVDADRIIACLTGMEPVPGLKLHANALFAKPASDFTGWRRWFHDPTPFHWLKKNIAISDDAIRAFLREHAMDPSIPLSRYAGTPKLMLGLEAAFARRPGVVVFSTAGLDSLGVREAFGLVAEHLPECSALYLSWPFSRQGQEQHDFFPNSARVIVSAEYEPTIAQRPA